MGDPGIGTHFLDTGPVFCLGGSPVIADLYDEHLLPDARVVEAVSGEVARRAVQRTERGDPRRHGPANGAARQANHRYRELLDGAAPRPDPAPPQLVEIEASMHSRALAKAAGRSIHPDEHRGEAESIHAALTEGALFVSCDGDAGREAVHRGLLPLTFVDLARDLRARQIDVKDKRLLAELQLLASRNIDIGEVVLSVLDLQR